jgi:ABC-2 type transport system permease protein
MNVLSKTNRAILSEMVRTDFKLRYQNSVLGYLWSLLRPLFISAIMYIVFVSFLKIGDDIRHKAAYLLLGIMCWTFFIEVTTGAVGSVVAKGDLIRKIAIPRYITVVSASVSALINFCFNLVVLGGVMLISGTEVRAGDLWMVPLLLGLLYVLSLAIAFILAAMFVKFRDVSFIWDVITQMLFYLTPILYPADLALSRFGAAKYLFLNPLAEIIQQLRYILVTPQAVTASHVLGDGAFIPLFVVILIGLFSVWYFRREARFFAENV